MFHCFGFSHPHVFSSIGAPSGWVGVELFFVLSGYLISNQIFSAEHQFSLKTFYYRRFLRTLPNYFVVVGLYFLIPSFGEKPLITPLWKFITFTQNFNLSAGAFSHAWSLCLEEQFYLVFPLVALLFVRKGSARAGWLAVGLILFSGIILRSTLWLAYIQDAVGDIHQIYMNKIYYPPFCRLDGLVLGVSIAMLQNFHKEAWERMTSRGNWSLMLGLLGCYFTFYPLPDLCGFIPTAFGYLLRCASFAALMLAALSPNTVLHKTKIPGAMTLSAWSYAIYLTHKSFIHITHVVLSRWNIGESSMVTVMVEIILSLVGGWILYTCIETPFLKLRDKLEQAKSTDLILGGNLNRSLG